MKRVTRVTYGTCQPAHLGRLDTTFCSGVNWSMIIDSFRCSDHGLTVSGFRASCTCSDADDTRETFLLTRWIASRATQIPPTMMPIRAMSPTGPPSTNLKVRTNTTSEAATNRPVTAEYQAQPRLA